MCCGVQYSAGQIENAKKLAEAQQALLLGIPLGATQGLSDGTGAVARHATDNRQQTTGKVIRNHRAPCRVDTKTRLWDLMQWA